MAERQFRQLPAPDQVGISRSAATPVDAFVRPGLVEQTNSLTELSRALTPFSQTLATLGAETRGLVNEQDTGQGRRDAERAGVMAEAEAVREGRMRAGSSPAYQRAWRETRGRAVGMQEAEQAMRDWFSAENEARNSDDPEALNRFLAERRQRVLEGADPHTSRGIMSAYEQGEARIRQAGAQEQVQREERRAEEALSTLFVTTMQQVRGAGASHEAAIAAAQEAGAGMRFVGLRGDRMNAILAQAITGVAQEQLDARWLRAAAADRPDITRPGQVVPGVSRIGAFTGQFAQAARGIESAAYQRAQLSRINEERNDRAALRNANESFGNRLEDWRRGGMEGDAPDLTAAEAAIIARYQGAQGVAQTRAVINAYRVQADQMGSRELAGLVDQITTRALTNGEDAQLIVNQLIADGTVRGAQNIELLRSAGRAVPDVRRLINEMPEMRTAVSAVAALAQGVESDLRGAASVAARNAGEWMMASLADYIRQASAGGQPPDPRALAEYVGTLRDNAAAYVTAWREREEVVTAPRWLPNEAPPVPGPNRRELAATEAQASRTTAPPPPAPMPRLTPDGQVLQPGQSPTPATPSGSFDPSQQPLRRAWAAVAGALIGGPTVNIPLPEGFERRPIMFPPQAVERLGFSGTGAPVRYSPGIIGLRVPTDTAVAALLRELSANPDDPTPVRAFNNLFGRNAAYYFVTEFNRRVGAGGAQ